MARARLVNTGRAHKRPQPTCDKCREVIEPGTQRYTWSFRYGGTYNRHEACGHPRPSELTQGAVGTLYAAQESVQDAMSFDGSTVDDFDSWKSDVAQALNDAAEAAREQGGEYQTAADAFGGAGENQERYEACESWAEALETAAGEVEGIEVDLSDVPGEDEDAEADKAEDADPDDSTDDDERDSRLAEAIDSARQEVDSLADDAVSSLEL